MIRPGLDLVLLRNCSFPLQLGRVGALMGVPSKNGQYSTLGMARAAQGPESALCEPGALPLVVAGQVDVLPAERGEVLEQLGIEGLSVPTCGLDCPLDVHRVPKGDDGRDESEAACAQSGSRVVRATQELLVPQSFFSSWSGH